jgi:hypothetical protein
MTASPPSSLPVTAQSVLERTPEGAHWLLTQADLLPSDARALLARLTGHTPLAALARDAAEAARFAALANALWRDALVRTVDVTLH